MKTFRNDHLYAEDHLAGFEAVTVLLENGEEACLNVAREVRIPSDPDKMIEAARRAPARLAFWAYQSERAFTSLRKAEREANRVEGYTYQVYRRMYENEGETPTEGMIRAALDQDPKVRKVRIAVSSRKSEYGVLRSMRDVMEHRAWMLRALLQHRET